MASKELPSTPAYTHTLDVTMHTLTFITNDFTVITSRGVAVSYAYYCMRDGATSPYMLLKTPNTTSINSTAHSHNKHHGLTAEITLVMRNAFGALQPRCGARAFPNSPDSLPWKHR